jgi:Pretoxin HINT domain
MTSVVMLVLSLTTAAPERAAYEQAKASAGRSSEAQVQLALWCEAQGLTTERVNHLARAVLIDPKNATARGLLGLVDYKGQWQRPEAAAEKVKRDEALSARHAEYRAKREKAADTADAQWALGLWCEENGLNSEARGHFTSVLQFDVKHEGAWKRLGYKKIRGRWVTDEQLAAEKTEIEAQRAADQKWKLLLTRTRARLRDRSQREEAEQALLEISDPRAVPAVVAAFVTNGVEGQGRAVEILGRIDSTASSRALATLAMAGGTSRIRIAAAETLRRRDPREFVGFLLAKIRDPVHFETGLILGENGYIYRAIRVAAKDRESLQRSGRLDELKTWVGGVPVERIDRDVLYISNQVPVSAVGKPLGYPNLPNRFFADEIPFDPFNQNFASPFLAAGTVPLLDQATGQMVQSLIANPQHAAATVANLANHPHPPVGLSHPINTATPADIMVNNATILGRTRDQQIVAALNQLPKDSHDYHNLLGALQAENAGVEQGNPPIFDALKRSTNLSLPDDREEWMTAFYKMQGYNYTPKSKAKRPTETEMFLLPSCFAAGTLVKTIEGSRPIEKIQVGDQVLAENTKTGALSFRAVVGLHHNPPGETLAVTLDHELIVPSTFHRFWLKGMGWKMARDLKAGDQIRTVNGLATVRAVEPSKVQPVFNLDIDKDHSFFVGQVEALVHDNTLPELRLAPFDVAPDLAAIAQAGK